MEILDPERDAPAPEPRDTPPPSAPSRDADGAERLRAAVRAGNLEECRALLDADRFFRALAAGTD